jgi:hypothetical protein
MAYLFSEVFSQNSVKPNSSRMLRRNPEVATQPLFFGKIERIML